MATKTPVNIGSLITSTPGVQGGRPCLVGTRMPVKTIAAYHMMGMNADQILEAFPHLDLARIHAGLAYYFANKDQIEAQIESDRRVGEWLAAKYPKGIVGPLDDEDLAFIENA